MRVLAVAAHPDDETLGAGATLARHAAEGAELHWLVATTRTVPRWTKEQVRRRRRQLDAVSSCYGFAARHELGFPDAELDGVPFAGVVEAVATVVAQVRPEIVYVVHAGDAHSDHGMIHRATMATLKAFRMRDLGVRRVLSYETLSSTEAAVPTPASAFLPTVYADVTGFLAHKQDAMALYDTEVQPGWLPRSSSAIEALARLRGAAIGVQHAEAFVLLRETW